MTRHSPCYAALAPRLSSVDTAWPAEGGSCGAQQDTPCFQPGLHGVSRVCGGWSESDSISNNRY